MRAALFFSLLLAAGLALAQVDYAKCHRDLTHARSREDKVRILRHLQSSGGSDSELQERLDELVSAWDQGYSWSPDPAIEMIELRALSLDKRQMSDANRLASEIKKSPLYRDPGLKESSNWIERSMRALGEFISALFRSRPESQMPEVRGPRGAFDLRWVVGLIYGLIAAVLLFFLYLAFRKFQWRATLKRKASAILEDDEPERTLDEWLSMADKLIGEGKYREAVRCLYLACLLRFDEAGVARFIRSQTNWEHLARIASSPALPPNLDFRPPTREFDRIWYGYRVNGIDDVAMFRDWYLNLTEALGGRS